MPYRPPPLDRPLAKVRAFDAAEQSANTAPSRAPGASRLAQVLRCSGVMSQKHSRTSIAYRSSKQSDRARDDRGVDAGSGVVEPVEKPDADAKCLAIRYSRLADTRSVPFSYFCTCWKATGPIFRARSL